MLDRLRGLRVEGIGRGGPHTGITHNEVTRAILARGASVVPRLVQRLDQSGFDEAVYIVFLLRELHANSAASAVRALQSRLGTLSVGRDLTLRMQIEYFLRDAPSW
ncbi:MAG TPA: hypothetical protein VKF61_10410 [Candidatus Polarisedimenticolia bacterium]|nr:hypothetical protein [Candidatus Polarisedimenticolia bacterium]